MTLGISMGKWITGLLTVGILVGCNAPAPQAPVSRPTAATEPLEPLPEVLPEPPAIAEPEPESDPAVPSALVGDPAVIAALRSEIEEKKALGSKLFQAGVDIDGHSHAGTAFNEAHIPEHTCVVLGRLLGKPDLVKPLEISYDMDREYTSEDDAQELRIMGISAGNFAATATYILEQSHDERIVMWNLDCSGKLGLPREFIEQTGQRSFYKIVNDGRVLKVLGEIEPGYAEKIIDAIEANPKIEAVALGSGGGLVYEAMRAGDYIRLKDLDTVLYNNCYSACPLVFMGGSQRQNWSPYPELGFHQVATQDGAAVSFDNTVYRDIVAYLVRMRIEPRYVIRQMWSSPPQAMTNVEGHDKALCDANIITWVQRGCSSRDYRSYDERKGRKTQ